MCSRSRDGVWLALPGWMREISLRRWHCSKVRWKKGGRILIRRSCMCKGTKLRKELHLSETEGEVVSGEDKIARGVVGHGASNIKSWCSWASMIACFIFVSPSLSLAPLTKLWTLRGVLIWANKQVKFHSVSLRPIWTWYATNFCMWYTLHIKIVSYGCITLRLISQSFIEPMTSAGISMIFFVVSLVGRFI